MRGAAFSVVLPPAAGYRAQPEVSTESGAVVRRWRAVAGRSRFCTVVAAEQAAYAGAFPAAAIAAFAAPREEGSRVIRNEVIRPAPRGTVAAVVQEGTFVSSLGAAGTIAGRVVTRQFLTPGRTLVSVSAAGPDGSTRCRPDLVAGSLTATGAEYTAPEAAP